MLAFEFQGANDHLAVHILKLVRTGSSTQLAVTWRKPILLCFGTFEEEVVHR